MLWDLRNARAPEKILTGHDKGVLSLSWCKKDPDLLLSSGKDNKTICWNPNSGENIGELPSTNNWSFQVEWNHRNPDIFANASFDGTIGIHSIQSSHHSQQSNVNESVNQNLDPNDIFGAVSAQQEAEAKSSYKSFSLNQAPKWLRRTNSASFGYGGKLVTLNNNQVQIRQVATEPSIIERAKLLSEAIDSEESEKKLIEICQLQENENKDNEQSLAGWKALHSLFEANSRDQLIELLGFSKEEVAKQVKAAIEAFPKPNENQTGELNQSEQQQQSQQSNESNISDAPERESTVSFAEPEKDVNDNQNNDNEKIENEQDEKTEQNQGENQQDLSTSDNLFGDKSDGDDFFRSVTVPSEESPQKHENIVVPHINPTTESSVAATIGSPGPSSVTSEAIKSNTFKIYPSEESESDRLITKALVLGDFNSAVELCLSTDRFADAILLAVKGGPELLAKTQKDYFRRQTTSLPYLRLFQSIVSDDLTDIVQNADLNEWQEIFVVVCTFANQEEFYQLAEQLGQRLDFQYRIMVERNEIEAKKFRTNAVLCFLAASKLERVVSIWLDEMNEEESKKENNSSSQRSQHALALQTFIEKVTIFQKATGYIDNDLIQKTEDPNVAASGTRIYKLSSLYDRYHEYADLLASQGLIQEAVKYVNLTPLDYQGNIGVSSDAQTARERLMIVANENLNQKLNDNYGTSSYLPPSQPTTTTKVQSPYQPSYQPTSQSPYQPTPQPTYQPSTQPVVPNVPQKANYGTYGQPIQSTVQSPPVQPSNQHNPYVPVPAPTTAAASAADTYNPYAPQVSVSTTAPTQPTQQPPPPPSTTTTTVGRNALPASQRRDLQGWNDAPPPPKRTITPQVQQSTPLAPITSPFPNSTPSPVGGVAPPPPASATSASIVPPPPRAGPRVSAVPPPPPPPMAQATISQPPPPPMAQATINQPLPPPPMAQTTISQPPPPSMGPSMQQRVPPPPQPQQYQQMPPQQMPPRPPSAGSVGGIGRIMSPSGGIQRPPSVNQFGGVRATPPPPPPHVIQQAMLQQQQQQENRGSVISPPPPPTNVGSPPISNVASYGGVTRPSSVLSNNRTGTPGVVEENNTKFPPGDRSNIPPIDKPIYISLNNEIEKLKTLSNVSNPS